MPRAHRPPLLIASIVALAVALPASGETYGEGVAIRDATPIAELAADPDRFAGETVRVEGEVDAVCAMKGCWMVLRDGGAEVRIKVPDDEIVFPAEAVGRRAAAQGTVEVVDMQRDEWIAWRRHLAEETGGPFDESAVGEGPFRRVRIAGTGAEIPLAP